MGGDGKEGRGRGWGGDGMVVQLVWGGKDEVGKGKDEQWEGGGSPYFHSSIAICAQG